MNIFVLDEDPRKAATYHCDKHVIKMILESAQLLSSAHWICGNKIPPYKLTHKNHPCSIWTRTSIDNYRWLISLGLYLCEEYTFRYGKIHKTQDKFFWFKKNEPEVKILGLTPFVQAMPEDVKDNNPVIAYRKYYIVYKNHLAQWKKRVIPHWYKKIRNEIK